jgi:polar amino acid transport system substrate-binding protein
MFFPEASGATMRRREFIKAAAASAVAWPLAAHAQQSAMPALRIAHDQSFPPFAEFKDGKSEGLAVDIFRAAAAQSGVDVKFVPVPFEQRQLTLTDGRADAYFPLSITPERLQLFDFTDALVVTGGSIFVRAPSVPPENLAALAGKTLVTPRTGPFAPFIQKTAPAVKLVETTDYEDSLGRLIRGEADAAALSYHVGLRISERLYPGQITRSPHMFIESPLAVAVPKGKQADVLARLNAGIAAIRANGTWQQINDRWRGK